MKHFIQLAVPRAIPHLIELFAYWFCSRAQFGHMTKFRWEIIIEGSVDGKEWKEYTFKYKPSALNKRPPFVPFQSVSNI